MDTEGKSCNARHYQGRQEAHPMRSEEQVDQGFENSARIQIANVENEEPTSIYNDVQFEINWKKRDLSQKLHTRSE